MGQNVTREFTCSEGAFAQNVLYLQEVHYRCGGHGTALNIVLSRVGNLTRLIHTLLYVMTVHTYIIHTYIHTEQLL